MRKLGLRHEENRRARNILLLLLIVLVLCLVSVATDTITPVSSEEQGETAAPSSATEMLDALEESGITWVSSSP